MSCVNLNKAEYAFWKDRWEELSQRHREVNLVKFQLNGLFEKYHTVRLRGSGEFSITDIPVTEIYSHWYYSTEEEKNPIPRKFTSPGMPMEFELEAEKQDFLKRFGEKFGYDKEKGDFKDFFIDTSTKILSAKLVELLDGFEVLGRIHLKGEPKQELWWRRPHRKMPTLKGWLKHFSDVQIPEKECNPLEEYPFLYWFAREGE